MNNHQPIPASNKRQVNLHKGGDNHGIHPDDLPRIKEMTDKAFEQIKAITSNNDNETLSVILGLITKYTFTQTREQVKKYNEDNTKLPDKEIINYLEDIVDALYDISQSIIREKITYKKMLIKVRRDLKEDDR